MCVVQSLTHIISCHFSITCQKLNIKKIKNIKYSAFVNFFLNNHVLQSLRMLTIWAPSSYQIDEILLYLTWNFNFNFTNTSSTSPNYKFELISQIHKTHLLFFKLTNGLFNFFNANHYPLHKCISWSLLWI